MDKRQPILIGCPQCRRLVSGTYRCDDRGRYALGPNGEFVLDRARCGQDAGRCAQTLCVLHRFNRRVAGSWYPTGIWALPQGQDTPSPAAQPADDADGWLA